MDGIGCQFKKRNEDKPPPVKFGVGNDEILFLKDLLPEEKNVKINNPRTPTNCPNSSHLLLNLQKGLQKRPRGQDSPHLGNGIDKIVLFFFLPPVPFYTARNNAGELFRPPLQCV